MLGCQPSVLTQRSMHHQKSSSDSPFQANTATPGTRQRFHQRCQEQQFNNAHRATVPCPREAEGPSSPRLRSYITVRTWSIRRQHIATKHHVTSPSGEAPAEKTFTATNWTFEASIHLRSREMSNVHAHSREKHAPFLCVRVCASGTQAAKLFSALFAAHRPLTAQQPLHSGWSKCYRRSSGTGPREPPESRSEPEGRRERWNSTADGWGKVKRTAKRWAPKIRWEILQQSGPWCECSPRSWRRLKVSRSALSSWAKSEPTYLKTRAREEEGAGKQRSRGEKKRDGS